MSMREVGTLIVGAGPAGMGPLLCAARTGELDRWLARGVLLIDAGGRIDRCSLAGYRLRADTAAASFLEGIVDVALPAPLAALRESGHAGALAAFGAGRPPLALAALWLGLVGETLARMIRAGGGELRMRSRLECLVATRDGSFLAAIGGPRGRTWVRAGSVVLALGGVPRAPLEAARASSPALAAALIRAARSHRLVGADAILRARCRLPSGPAVIVGGAHGAFSAAWRLCKSEPQRAVSVLHRHRIRVTYESASDARDDGYREFSEADVCPATQRVHRLGGLRGDGRALWRRATGRDGESNAIELVSTSTQDEELAARVDRARIVVSAIGYVPRTIPLYGEDGARIALSAEQGGPAAGRGCGLLRSDGSVIPGAFTIGMASGYNPSEDGDGEPSFRGATNGIWLYRHRTGARVVHGVRAHLAR